MNIRKKQKKPQCIWISWRIIK